jgi:O-methyltransferase involved in polyketide biosynthesis
MSLRTDHHRAAAQLHTAAADVRSIAAQRAANITSASPGRIEDQRSTPQVTCGNNSQSTPDDQGELAMPSHAPEATASGDSPTLRRVRSEFPGFEIWRETAVDRIRFIARARDLGTSPHTVITGDLGELRDALAGQIGTAGLPGEGEDRRPNIARMYSSLTAGKDHMTVDRQAVDLLLADFPEIAAIARANREFVTGAVARVAAHGIGAFIDVGAGLPTALNVHEVVQQVNPSAVTCYVDTDEIVLAHARALLAAGPRVTVAQGDLRQPGEILKHPALATAIDLDQPVCLILASVLHFLEAGQADTAVATLKEAVAPGSYLVISAGTTTGTDPVLVERACEAYAHTSVITGRPEGDIVAWFEGWHLLPPGLPDVRNWRTDGLARLPQRRPEPRAARVVAGIGRKPAR